MFPGESTGSVARCSAAEARADEVSSSAWFCGHQLGVLNLSMGQMVEFHIAIMCPCHSSPQRAPTSPPTPTSVWCSLGVAKGKTFLHLMPVPLKAVPQVTWGLLRLFLNREEYSTQVMEFTDGRSIREEGATPLLCTSRVSGWPHGPTLPSQLER